MTKESWKIIEDYPSYMVSNKGNILNIRRGRTMKPCPNGDGYLTTALRKKMVNLIVYYSIGS